jgi:hypothetical protein
MSTQNDRTFRPRLEAFEERNLPSMISNFFNSLFGGGSPALPPAENLGAGQSLPASGRAIAASQLNGFTTAGNVTPGAPQSSGGSSLLVTTDNSSALATSSTVSSTSSTTSVAAVNNTLTLNPDGTVSGNFFDTSGTSTGATTATPGTAGAVPTLVSTVGGSSQSFSSVPDSTNFGLTDPISSVPTTSSVGPGLTTPGLITPATLRNDTGFNIAT